MQKFRQWLGLVLRGLLLPSLVVQGGGQNANDAAAHAAFIARTPKLPQQTAVLGQPKVFSPGQSAGGQALTSEEDQPESSTTDNPQDSRKSRAAEAKKAREATAKAEAQTPLGKTKRVAARIRREAKVAYDLSRKLKPFPKFRGTASN